MTNAFSLLSPEIRYNKKLSSSAKILYCEIYALNYGRIFKIKNKTLANDLGFSITQISRLISELKKNNLLLTFDIAHERRLMVTSLAKEEKKRAQPQLLKKELPKALIEFYKMLDFKD